MAIPRTLTDSEGTRGHVTQPGPRAGPGRGDGEVRVGEGTAEAGRAKAETGCKSGGPQEAGRRQAGQLGRVRPGVAGGLRPRGRLGEHSTAERRQDACVTLKGSLQQRRRSDSAPSPG